MDNTWSLPSLSFGSARAILAIQNIRLGLNRSAGNLTEWILASARVRAMETGCAEVSHVDRNLSSSNRSILTEAALFFALGGTFVLAVRIMNKIADFWDGTSPREKVDPDRRVYFAVRQWLGAEDGGRLDSRIPVLRGSHAFDPAQPPTHEAAATHLLKVLLRNGDFVLEIQVGRRADNRFFRVRKGQEEFKRCDQLGKEFAAPE